MAVGPSVASLEKVEDTRENGRAIAFLKRLRELREMAASPDRSPQQTLLQLLDDMTAYLQHRVTVEDSSIREDRTA